MKEIQKSLPIARAELDTQIRTLINNTKMPFCIIEYVIKDIYNEVRTMAAQELKVEVERYTETAKNEKTESE